MPVESSWNDGPDDSSIYRIQYDDDAFEFLFKSHFVILCSYCQAKYGFNLDSAKEAVHSSFIKLWENRNSISDSASVKAYLYKIVSNTCLDLIKHKKVIQLHEKYVMQHAQTTYQDLDLAEAKMLKVAIDKAVAELPHQMRKVFELSRYEGFKYAQIANLLNISIKTVETQMSRALSKLRQSLAKYGPLCCLIIIS
ncbi:MAG: RNA polymerase sigma-70 factor [Flavitalea sp.]